MGTVKHKKKHKGQTKFNKFTKVWSILFFLSLVAFIGVAIYLDVLPIKYLCIGVGILVAISLIIFITLYSNKFKKSRKVISLIFSIILMVGFGVGIVYISGTNSFFSSITKVDVQTEDYYVVVRDDSKYKKIEDIEGKTIQTYETKEVNYSAAKGKLKNKVDVEYDMIEQLSGLADGLLNKDYEIIFISAAHYDTICTEHTDFEKDTRILYTVKVEIKTGDISKDVDVTKDSFNIYISGLDINGKIDVVSRSDVNMIATINPKTHTVLLTSIPRDYAVNLPSKENAMDKLTHTGIYGISETVGAVEQLMGIDINYYAKVNYSTVTKFVDAIGGIDVNSDFTFTTSGMDKMGLSGITFTKGMNYLDGARALAFARERHSFNDGDVQRNKNQQKIVKAIIKKAASSKTLLTKYSSILSSIEEYVEINMTSKDIKKIVKMQLEDMPNWKIKTQNIEGVGGYGQCYSTGTYQVYVMNADDKSVIAAVDNIVSVMDGTDKKKTSDKEK